MNYDPNKYREVGVGNTIHPGHVIAETEDCGTYTAFTQRSPHNHEIGTTVLDSTPYTVLERIEQADTGIRKQRFATGSSRSDATGRGRFDLIPFEAMLSLARRYEMGAAHFGERDWERGQPLSRLLSSMRRHAMQINYDYSEDHAGAVLWNAAAFVTMVERMRAGILPRELDDVGYFANEEASK